jgi:hypothetical protein
MHFPPSPDRRALRSELEATRSAFQALAASLSDDQWQQRNPASAWTMGEVLVHLTWALEQLPKEVASARRGNRALADHAVECAYAPLAGFLPTNNP